MTDLNETLAGMRAKTDAATRGPWRATDPHPFQPGAQIRLYGPDWEPIRIEASNERHVWATPNAEFIVMARTAMPALLSAVENVLALCDEADARQPEYFGFLVTPDVRKALSDALEGGCAVDHAERCCSEHGTHSMPHRGCILR